MSGSQSSLQNTQSLIPSEREYDGAVLFNWGKGQKKPFRSFDRNVFDTFEIRPEYYQFQLTPQSRIKKLKPLMKYPNQSISMFAKLEKGRIFYTW